jgi:hypothetical protein
MSLSKMALGTTLSHCICECIVKSIIDCSGSKYTHVQPSSRANFDLAQLAKAWLISMPEWSWGRLFESKTQTGRPWYLEQRKLWLLFRTEEFLSVLIPWPLVRVHVIAVHTIALYLFFSKTTTPTNFISCTHVAWVSAYKFCAQQLHQIHTGHTACQNVPKKHFL